MNPEEQLLKEKALLLLSRERELWALRKKHGLVSAWLEVARTLPEIVSVRASPQVTYPALSQKLISLLKLQEVAFYEVIAEGLCLLSGQPGDVTARAIPADLAGMLAEAGAGICNHPDTEALRALADTVRLHRFMWFRTLDRRELPAMLIVAGYTRDKASFYPPFVDADFGHFKNMGEQLQVLLRNAALLEALEREKRALVELNETLERRVTERTEELAQTNENLALAVGTLQEKDRRLNDDLEQARSFQQTALPNLPSSPLSEFEVVFRPLDLVGGDVYDVLELHPGHFRIFMADVTGHGVQAALRTIVLRGEYDALKTAHDDPDTLLADLNGRLTRTFREGEMLCTGSCFDVICGERPTLRYMNAAHPPLLVVSNGRPTEVYRDGPFLGLHRDSELGLIEIHLQPGDWIFAYTDGLCDQTDAGGRLFPVEARVLDALGSEPTPREALAHVMRSFDAFRGDVPTKDDVVIVAMRLAPRA